MVDKYEPLTLDIELICFGLTPAMALELRNFHYQVTQKARLDYCDQENRSFAMRYL